MIFEIKCEDEFLSAQINSILKDLLSLRTVDDNYNKLFTIQINKVVDQIFIYSSFTKKFNTSTPVEFSKLSKIIEKICQAYRHKVNNLIYFPFKQQITFQQAKINLNDIHNLIFINLIISKKGVCKNLLYKVLWSKDKEINMNKLDTHLTNLKSLIKEKLDVDLSIVSKKNILMIN
ncbi:MAG: hypothetical protein ACJ0RK_05465 [Alphaproteobacteria bacterium]